MLGCDGTTCVVSNWKGDGFCDSDLHCSDHGFDGDDCLDLALDLGSVCSGAPTSACLQGTTELVCAGLTGCAWKNGVQVEGSIYVGLTLAIDISVVPSAVSASVTRLEWETQFITEMTTVLSSALVATNAICGSVSGACGPQIRFVGVQAGSVIVTIQLLPPGAADLLTALQAAIADPNSVLWTLALLGQIDPSAILEFRSVPVTTPSPSNSVAPGGGTTAVTPVEDEGSSTGLILASTEPISPRLDCNGGLRACLWSQVVVIVLCACGAGIGLKLKGGGKRLSLLAQPELTVAL